MKRYVSPLLLPLLLVANVLSQTVSKDEKRPFNMLVLGDSILWGQGLKAEHKSWYQVKTWLEQKTGRSVDVRVEAHSGAVIDLDPSYDPLSARNPEVNVALPTLNQQLDNVAKFYADPSQVDLVLFSGCGNDVGLLNLLNASDTKEINRLTEAHCGAPMEKLLRRIATSFPSSIIVVAGYYPIFSERTRNDFVLKGLTKRFLKATPGSPRTSSKEVLVRLTSNSKDWYEASNNTLGGVVQTVNEELGAGPTRIYFAKIQFPAEYAFAANETRLWGFDRFPLRMMVLFLSFGRTVLPANDEVRGTRVQSCKEVFRREAKETNDQRKEHRRLLLLCKYASLGHPNQKGAALYAQAIIQRLTPLR